MVTAIATYTIPDPAVKPSERDTDLEAFEVSEEGDTWESAQARCEIPDGALLLHWLRG